MVFFPSISHPMCRWPDVAPVITAYHGLLSHFAKHSVFYNRIRSNTSYDFSNFHDKYNSLHDVLIRGGESADIDDQRVNDLTVYMLEMPLEDDAQDDFNQTLTANEANALRKIIMEDHLIHIDDGAIYEYFGESSRKLLRKIFKSLHPKEHRIKTRSIVHLMGLSLEELQMFEREVGDVITIQQLAQVIVMVMLERLIRLTFASTLSARAELRANEVAAGLQAHAMQIQAQEMAKNARLKVKKEHNVHLTAADHLFDEKESSPLHSPGPSYKTRRSRKSMLTLITG